MALSYTPPGVKVSEVVTPTVGPQIAAPATLCLVGLSEGYITTTEALVLNGTTAATLTGLKAADTMASDAIVKIMDANNPALAPNGYAVTTDYTFNASAHTITRVGGGTIPDGSTVYVTYKYTPTDYFSPIRLANLSDVEGRFGSAWNTAGTAINSHLSHAASIAFENGAQEIVLQPLFHNNAGTKQQPNDTQHATATTWADNYVVLRDYEDINVVVPVIGQSQASVGDSNQLGVIQATQDHIKFMKDQQQLILGVVGEDSSASSSVAQKATLLTHAATVAGRYGGEVTEQLVFVSPSKFTRPLPTTTGEMAIGGQFMAAAIGGMIAARPVSQPITRKAVSGFFTVADPRTKAERNADAATGLCVVEQRGGVIQVRHGITLNTTGGTAQKEITVVRAKHRVMESVRDTIETQIIGNVIADGNAPGVVASAIDAVLEQLQNIGDIVDYGAVAARTLSLDPAHIEVRFSYLPAFPVNYVTVNFSLNVNTGDLTVPSTTTSNATF